MNLPMLFPATLLMLFVSIVSAQDKPVSTPVEGKIEWVFDYEEGKQQSKKTGKPMFVVIRCER